MSRIHWTDDEQDLFVERMAELLREKPRIRKEDLWVRAQDGIIAEDRRRKWFNSYGSNYRELFDEAAKRAEQVTAPVATPVEREPEVQFVPVPTPTPLSEFPLNVLLAEVFGRIIEQWSPRQSVDLLQDEAQGTKHPPAVYAALNEMLFKHEPARERAVRIAVVGLLPDQFRRVKERINARKVELVLVGSQGSGPDASDWKRALDHALVTRFMRHGHYEHAKATLGNERVHWVSNGTDAIVAKIVELVPGSAN